MVPVTVERWLHAHTEGKETAFGVFRSAAERLPTRDDPLLDRLFALECLLRAGSAARAVVQGLMPARRDAVWRIEQEWEPDIPHVAILGQAISTIEAAGEDPPATWGSKLAEAVTEIATRRTRLGLNSNPALLAAVLRGMAVARITPPESLLDGIRNYLAASPDPVVTAELADALGRGRSYSQLARQAVAAAFTSPEDSTVAAIARWWLAERWQALQGESPLVSTGAIDDARIQALSSPLPMETAIVAMLAEVTGRSIGKLVIVPSTRLGELRERMRVRTLVENCVWRIAFSSTLSGLFLVHLTSIVAWLTRQISTGTPPTAMLRTAAGAIVTIAVLANVTAMQALYRRLGRDMPVYLSLLTGILTALGGFYAYLRYP